jgi:hypothetical protein
MADGINYLTAVTQLKAGNANDDLKTHGTEPKQHGTQVQAKAKGSAKTCPHCGKPC